MANEHILVVDDDQILAEYLKAGLSEDGITRFPLQAAPRRWMRASATFSMLSLSTCSCRIYRASI
jgi:DNA-binding response OmpR family regulator